MTSYLDSSTIDNDYFKPKDTSEKTVNFDDHILRLYAQEIEDNQVNEIIEAQLRDNSSENSNCRTAKEIIKKYNLSQRKPVPPPKLTIASNKIPRNIEHQISELESKFTHLKKRIEEETRNKNISNQNKSILPLKFNKHSGAIPKYTFSYQDKESLPINSKEKLFHKPQTEIEINNSTRNRVVNSVGVSDFDSCTTQSSQSQSFIDKSTLFQIKSTGHLHGEISNSFPIPKMANADIAQYDQINEDNGYMSPDDSSIAIIPPSLPSRPPPVYKYSPSIFNKVSETSTNNQNHTFSNAEKPQNILTKRNESYIGFHRGASNEGKYFSSATNKNTVQLFPPFVEQRDINKIKAIRTQNSLLVDTGEEVSKSSKLVTFSPKTNNKDNFFVSEKNGKTRNNDINVNENQNGSVLVGDNERVVVKPDIPKKPSKQIIQKRIEQILIKQLSNSEQIQNPRKHYEATNLQKSILSDNVNFNSNSETNFSKTDSLRTDMKIIDGRIAEITFFDRDKIRKIVGQRNTSGNKSLLNSEEKVSNGNSPCNQDLNAQDKQRKTSKENLLDLDPIFDSITRPELPQKLRSTQRSVSYSSLVQSFKDFSVALWSAPPERNKRCSIDDVSFTTESKNIESERNDSITRNRHLVSSNEDVTRDRNMSNIGKDDLNRYSWFHDVKISVAIERLLDLGQDGAFLVRPSSKPTVAIPYTASVIQSGKIFNIHIRHKADRQYALGKEKKAEKTFSSISDLVKYHQDVPFEIYVSANTPHKVYFRVTPPR